jgi:hypothetical protein
VLDLRQAATPTLVDEGIQLDDLWLVVQADQSADFAAAGAATLTITLESDTAVGLATSPVVHFATAAIAKATLVKGYVAVRTLLPSADYQRYLGPALHGRHRPVHRRRAPGVPHADAAAEQDLPGRLRGDVIGQPNGLRATLGSQLSQGMAPFVRTTGSTAAAASAGRGVRFRRRPGQRFVFLNPKDKEAAERKLAATLAKNRRSSVKPACGPRKLAHPRRSHRGGARQDRSRGARTDQGELAAAGQNDASELV